MVAQLARLKLRLLVNGFRRSPWVTVGFIFAALYVAGIVTSIAVGIAISGRVDPDIARQLVVVLGGALVLGWWVGPLLTSGMDATLDPRRFVTFGIPRRQLVLGLGVATLIGIGGVALVVLALATVTAWTTTPIMMPVALIGAALGVLTCVVGARALTGVLAPVMESRRAREVTRLIAVLGGVAAWLAFVRFTNGSAFTFTLSPESIGPLLNSVAEVAAWTPFGAPWALAGDVSDGAWLALMLRVAIIGATLALAWRGWSWALGRELTGGERHDESASAVGLGWFGRLPATPTGAVAARCATYWRRDPRYSNSLVFIPVVPVAIVLLSGGGLTTPALLIAAPIIAFILGFGTSSDIAYDSTAFALHVSTGVSGRSDRWGRALPVIVAGVPFNVLVVAAAAGVSGRWDLFPVTLGVSLMTFGATLGTASIASVYYLYPVPQPGESPFKSPQNAGIAPLIGQLGAMLVAMVVALPILIVAGFALFFNSALLGALTAIVGAGLAVVAVVAGVRIGARVFERRAPALLQQVATYR